MPTPAGFLLGGGDDEFNGRQKQLFDQLRVAEKNLNKDRHVIDEKSETQNFTSPKSSKKREVKRFRGKDSIFKKPNYIIPRNRFSHSSQAVPDYHKNPSKWTKYRLEDSPEMTEKSNSQAAFAFLNQLKNAQELDKEEDEKMDVSEIEISDSNFCKRNQDTQKIIFKKKLQKVASENSVAVIEKEEKPIFRNSKMIMPECVVGEKPKRIKEKKIKKVLDSCDRKYIKLGHLDELEEDN